jgi:REP element-mobilizing transposase RayT
VPRKPRDTAEGIYHVAARAAVDEALFRDDRDFFSFELEVERIVSPECTLIGACALDTHYHLILETTDGVLARAVKQLNHRYALTFNARYGRRGHAFAGRYMSVRIKSDEQLATVYRYVARNPVEAGACDEPAEWRWSSYREAIGLPGRFAFADPSRVLEFFDGSVEQLRVFVETPWESDRRAEPKAGSDTATRSQTPSRTCP